jgi:hypothetical protein
MTVFNVDFNTQRPDRVFVEVDRRFDVAIVRTVSGLTIQIYPRTDGDLWDDAFTTFEVAEADIIELEKEMQP